jgi:cysteine-rich repeat protein
MKKHVALIIMIMLVLEGVTLVPNMTFAEGYCGDKIVNNNEECDDGNFANRDGCNSYCILEDMIPPSIKYVSISEGTTGVPTTTNEMTVTFSEPVNPDTINAYNVKFKQFTKEFSIDRDLQDDGVTLIIKINEDLEGESQHSLVITNVEDIPGNAMPDIFVRSFTTGVEIDHTAPNIVVDPEGGEYNVAQSVSLTPYIGQETWSTDFLDKDAVIYYTLDNSTPTTQSSVYTTSISVKKNTVLKFFGVDKLGNRSDIQTHTYRFTCGERPNAVKVSPYPTCVIQECDYGFELKSNVCVMRIGTSVVDDYKLNAATAPLFGSDTPMTISTKPALYITPEHRGVIPRPVIFKDEKQGTSLFFGRDTKIIQADGLAFSGYILPPKTLYTKDFPLYFGYTFKSIFKFEPAEQVELFFDPLYKITIPFTDRYTDDPITVFTYDPETELYTQYPQDYVLPDFDKREVSILAEKTQTFFIAQPGLSYNKAEFLDMIGHWAQYYAESLYRRGIVKGKSKGIFAPADYLTRAEFIKITLNSIAAVVDPLEDVETAPFSDIPLYAWYVPYIKKAKELGLINGYPDGTFLPDNPINKAEAIKILMTAFKFNLMSAGARDDAYTDVYTDQWYFPAVNFAIQNKLADGIRLPNGTIMDDSFGPGRSITRGEMAKLAIKALEFSENADQK